MNRFIGQKLSFVDKGIAIILASSLAAVACLAVLEYQRTLALNSAARDCKYVEFVIELSGLVEKLSNYCGENMSFVLQDKPHWRELAVLEKSKIKNDLAHIRQNILLYPPLADIASRIETRFATIQRLVEGEGGDTGLITQTKLSATLKRAPQFFSLLEEMAGESLQLIIDQSELQSANSAQVSNWLALQKAVCVSGFFIVLAGSIFFLRNFYFGIRRRLDKLSGNALALADANPKFKPLDGQDEFARLNKILEDVLERLRRSGDARTFLLCMAAHDMRSPLASANISLELVSRESPELLPVVGVATAAVEQVLPFIDDLLQIEKTQSEGVHLSEDFLLDDFSDTELGACVDMATAAGIGISFEFSSQIVRVNQSELASAIILIVGYLIKNLNRGSQIILSADSGSPESWRIYFTINAPADVAKPLSFLEEDLGAVPELSSRTIKLHPALYHVDELGASLKFEGFTRKNSGRLVLQRSPIDIASRAARRSASEAATRSALEKHVSRPWLASFMLLLAVPTIIQTFAFIGIYKQVEEAGKLLDQTQECMRVILLLSRQEILAMRVATTGFSAGLSTSDRVREKAFAAFSESSKFVEAHGEEFKKIPGIASCMDEVRRLDRSQMELLQNINNNGVVEYLQEASEIEVYAGKVGRVIRDFLTAEQQALVARVDSLRDVGAPFKLIALLGAVDFLVLLLMTAIFRSYFLQRYRQMEFRLRSFLGPSIENLDRTGGVFSNDELSVLEKAVDLASVQIQANSDYRQAFISVVRREIAGPINRAQQVLKDALSGSSMLSSRNRERITQALRSFKLVLLLVDDLDNLEKMEHFESGNIEFEQVQFPIAALIGEAVEVLSALAEGRGVSLVLDTSHEQIESTYVIGDRKKLLQALINLVGNAIKFSPMGTSVRITVHCETKTVSIAVRDSGPGLKTEQVERLFLPFYQAESSEKSKGFGFGLASARCAIEAHGGRLYVSETGPEGTTFVMQLHID